MDHSLTTRDRPSCSRCQNLRTECQYEAEEGESRWSALRRRNQVLEQERDQLRELLNFVQTMPEPDAAEVFRHIRMSSYDDVFILLRQIKEGIPAIQPNLGSLPPPNTQGPEQRLPPIQAILGDTTRVMPPAHLTQSHSLSSEDSRGSSISELAYPGQHHIVPAMEARLHPRPHSRSIGPPGLSLSSEESAGSIGSATIDPTRPYASPTP